MFLKIHRELSIAVSNLSQAGVEHLINMKRLHTLEMVTINWVNYNPDIFLTVAGNVPSLRNFSHRSSINENQFVEEFGEKYPQKELVINNA
jgi:hypothetical protein